jgi:hypothetical protein
MNGAKAMPPGHLCAMGSFVPKSYRNDIGAFVGSVGLRNTESEALRKRAEIVPAGFFVGFLMDGMPFGPLAFWGRGGEGGGEWGGREATP